MCCTDARANKNISPYKNQRFTLIFNGISVNNQTDWIETTRRQGADVCPKLDSFSSFSGLRGRGTEGRGSPHLAASLKLFWVCPRRQVHRDIHQLYHSFPWYLSLHTYDWMGRTIVTWHADKCVCAVTAAVMHLSFLTYATGFLFEHIHLPGCVGMHEM